MEQIIYNLSFVAKSTSSHLFINSGKYDNVIFEELFRWWESFSIHDRFYSHSMFMGCLGIMSIFFFLQFLFIIYKFVRSFFGSKRNRVLWSTLVVLNIGYIIYFIGFYYEGTSQSFWALLFRPLVSSMEMFVAQSDLIEVCEVCKDSPIYMTWFAITHFCAIFISFYVVLNWVWQRLKKWGNLFFTKMYFNFTKWKSVPNLYIFFDTNDSAWTLAKSIVKHEEREKKDYRIIFVDEPEEVEDDKEKKTFIDLLNIKAFRKSTQERINSKEVKKALFVRSEKNISSDFSSSKYNLWEETNLENVADLIKKSEHTHIFLFSEDEQDNISATWNLQKDSILNRVGHTIYCKARDNYANRAAVNQYLRTDVKLIDDSSLSIDVLKKWKEGIGVKETYPAHPINFVKNNNKKGWVESHFTALIIGCGRTGRDSMRFLYEFGAFVGENKEKSPFSCYIIDKNMSSIKGGMERNIPALPSLEKEIIFWDMDFNSNSFRLKLGSIINDLNYVVIAAGDDEQNMNMAIDIYEFTIRNRNKGLTDFRIFVRAYDKSNERKMTSIEEFYSTADKHEVIKVFGKKDEIYTYNNIINDLEEKKLAGEYFKAYQRAAHSFDYNNWEERHKEISNLTNDYTERLKLEQLEKQDYSNVLHMYTKIKLCDYIHKKTIDTDIYPFDTINDNLMYDYIQCMLVLSKMEHLRWNAAHYMAGFVFGKKDFRKKTHNCLKPFDGLNGLDKVTQRYDYAVVKTTIDLYQLRNNINAEEESQSQECANIT